MASLFDLIYRCIDWKTGMAKVRIDGFSIPNEEPLPVKVPGEVDVSDNADRKLGKVDARLQGSDAEKSSAQDTQPATTVKTYTKAAGASQIEVYCETGYIRVRTDGQPCTSDTGEPLGAGFGAAWTVESISVFCVQESVYTVVIR